MDANLVLWILQVVLALAFLGAGGGHAFGYDRMSTQPRTSWMAAVGRRQMQTIGILEILGAIGLVLPAATGILPWLTPLAASALALLMIFAIAFHARRPGEGSSIVLNAVLGAVGAIIAIGRVFVAPL